MRFEPYVLYLSTTYTCNFECRNCYAVDDKPKDLPRKVVEDIIDGAADEGFAQISLSGGEITLFPEDLKQYSKRIFEKGIISGLVTNGWFGVDKRASENVIKHLNFITTTQISLDSFHEEAFKKVYPKKDYLKSITNSTKLLLDTGIDVVFRTIDSPITKEHNDQLCSTMLNELRIYPQILRSECLPYGRGERINNQHFETKPFSKILEKDGDVCTNTSLGVSPIGVYFCCTPPGASDDYVLIKPDEFEKYGKNIIQESIKRANNSEKVDLIMNKGIKELYNQIKTDKDPKGLNDCSVCKYALHKLGGIL